MTVSELIDQLGGTAAVARLFGITPAAVSNWRHDGRFPARVHYRLHLVAKERRINVPPSLLGEGPAPEPPDPDLDRSPPVAGVDTGAPEIKAA